MSGGRDDTNGNNERGGDIMEASCGDEREDIAANCTNKELHNGWNYREKSNRI